MRGKKKRAKQCSPGKQNAEVLRSHAAKNFLRYIHIGKNNKLLTADLMKKTFGPMKQPCFIYMWRRHATVTNRLDTALAKVVSTQRYAFLEASIGLWMWNKESMPCSYINLQKEMVGVGAATTKVFSCIINSMAYNIKRGELDLEVKHEFDGR